MQVNPFEMSSNNTSDHSSLFDSATSTPRHIRSPSSVIQYPSKSKSRAPSQLLVSYDYNFLKEVNRVLQIYKDNSDADMLSLYYQLKYQPQCQITHDLMDLIHAFLSIPCEKFSLTSFAHVLQELAYCFAQAVDEQLIYFYASHFIYIVYYLTSLAAILSGALSVKKPEQCVIPQLDQLILTQYNFLKDLEQYIPFFSRKRVLAKMKVCQQAAVQVGSLRRYLVSIYFDLFDQLDLLDGLVRSQLKLYPPKFPSNVSPVERILQFMMDKIEMNSFFNIGVIYDLGKQFTQEKTSKNFHQDNPFIFDVYDSENDIFSEYNNNFYKYSAIFPRPRILDALADHQSSNKSQKALFVLEIQAQFLNLLSFLSEESEKQFSILDYYNLLNVVKFLCEIVNCCFPYVIKNYFKLQYILTKISFKQFYQMYEQFLSRISQEYAQFMKMKLGFISVYFIAYYYLLETLSIVYESKNLPFYEVEEFYNNIPVSIYEEPLNLSNFSQTAIFSTYETAFFRFYIKEDIVVFLLQLIKIYVSVLNGILYQPGGEFKAHYETQDTLLYQALAEMRSARFTDDFVKQALNSYPECPEVRQLVYQLAAKHEEQIMRYASPRKDEMATPPIPESLCNFTGSGVFSKVMCLPKTPTLYDFVPIYFVSKGGYGCVVHVMNKSYRHHFAIKIIRKEDIIRKNSVNRVKLEQTIYRHIKECNDRHPVVNFVVKFYGSFKTDQFLFLVLEYCPHGDLGMMLECCGCFTHATTLQYISELAQALHYLHVIGIVYNDLKPENILLASDGHLKFTDFGISKLAFMKHQCECLNNDTSPHLSYQPSRASFSYGKNYSLGSQNGYLMYSAYPVKTSSPHMDYSLKTRKKAYSVVGTPYYLAPEILQSYGSSIASDYWALGVCLYEFTFGVRPFDGDSPEDIFQNILSKEPDYFDEFFQEGMKDDSGVLEVIKRLLVKEPAKRLSNFDELKRLSFFENVKWNDLLGYMPPYVPAPIELSEEPMKIYGDWVNYVVTDAGFANSRGDQIPSNIDDYFQGFSYVNVEAYKELQQRVQNYTYGFLGPEQ